MNTTVQIPTSQKQFAGNYQSYLQKNTLPVVELSKKIQLKIPKNVVQQIRYLCNKVPKHEWSGILMYKLIGNFSTGNFSCVVKDIFLMDIGSSTYTEYEFGERFIKYRMEHSNVSDCETGHCHSHNSMSCFFSGTDMQELQDNAPNYNYYLSLIVNNAFEPTAKIAFVGEQEKTENIVRSFFGDNGKLYKFNNKVNKKEKVLFIYNCEIVYDSDIKVSQEFENRFLEIVAEKEAEAKALKAAKELKASQQYLQTSFNFNSGEPRKNLKVYNNYSEFSEFEASQRADYVEKEDDDVTDDLEDVIADALMLTYSSKKDIEEALFQANTDFKQRGDEFITECGNCFRSYAPFMLGVDELSPEDLQEAVEILSIYGEDTFPKLTEALIIEFLK
jgi:proteasome lid subunit RPN8/RPN11